MADPKLDVTPATAPAAPGDQAAISQLSMGRVLRPLVYLATAVSAYLHARQFFFPDFMLRYNPDEAYIVILAAYSGHRELRRWSNDPQVITQTARRGEFFVVGWWTAYFVSVLIANQALRYRVPGGLESLCMQITAIFFGTLASQHLFKGRPVRTPRAETMGSGVSLEEKVVIYLREAKQPIRRSELADHLDVSRSTVFRVLDDLEDKGYVEWVGNARSDPRGGFQLRTPKPKGQNGDS